LRRSQTPEVSRSPHGPSSGNLVVVVASRDTAQCLTIKGVLKEHEFEVVDGPMQRAALPVERLLKPSAFVVQVDPDPAKASERVASLRLLDPDVPIVFAVEQNTEQLEINVRQMGIQYYMLLPAESEELVIVVNSLVRA